MKNSELEFHHFPAGSPAFLRRAAKAVLKAESGAAAARVCFVMVSDKTIKKLNRRFRGVKRITDVISFRFSKKPLTGDIYISKGRSRKQAAACGNTWKEELCYLVLHGMLHLFDYTDYKPLERRKMFAVQDRLFGRLKIVAEPQQSPITTIKKQRLR